MDGAAVADDRRFPALLVRGLCLLALCVALPILAGWCKLRLWG